MSSLFQPYLSSYKSIYSFIYSFISFISSFIPEFPIGPVYQICAYEQNEITAPHFKQEQLHNPSRNPLWIQGAPTSYPAEDYASQPRECHAEWDAFNFWWLQYILIFFTLILDSKCCLVFPQLFPACCLLWLSTSVSMLWTSERP